MKIMLDASPSKIDRQCEKFKMDFWQLRTPLTGNAIGRRPYGLDNGCFSGRLPKPWDRLLREAKEGPRPVFVTLPDVVGSARRTAELFEIFKAKTAGLPRALVLQDGIDDVTIPWDDLDAIFIGGSDPFKISSEAFAAARCARVLGKWVHVGRVNGTARLGDWLGLADSIDGSGISRFDHMLSRLVDFLRYENVQLDLPMDMPLPGDKSD